jgi:hypothetical protein
MKIQRDDAIKKAETLMKKLGIPPGRVDASHVKSDKGNYWLVSFAGSEDKKLMDGNVSFVEVNDETGEAQLRPYP